MGRYTIRAYGGRLIARISTERHDHTLRLSVSQINESEKPSTAWHLHFHIHYQSPTFLHRQSHVGRFHANQNIAANRDGLVRHTRGVT